MQLESRNRIIKDLNSELERSKFASEKFCQMETDVKQMEQSTHLADKTKESLMKQNQELVRNLEVLQKRMESERCGPGEQSREELKASVQRLTKRLADSEETITNLEKRIVHLASLEGGVRGSNQSQEALSAVAKSKERYKKERDEAVRKNALLRDFYKNEISTVRVVLGHLLGWDIKLERADGQVITTLRSKYAPPNDDAELIFSLPTDQLDALLGAVPDTNSALVEPHFELTFEGRFASKWEHEDDWRLELSGRNSYPSFLAKVCRDEHDSFASKGHKRFQSRQAL